MCMLNNERDALRILAVDDTPANLDLLSAVLGYAGYEVITASSGQEAVEKFSAYNPDIVLMDVMMPVVSGIEATRRIRKLQGERWVPIIFVSALSHRDDVVAGLEAGGDDYISKPIDVVMLLTKIKVMRRIALLEDRLLANNAELELYREKSEQELMIARELMEQMIAGSSAPVAGISTWIKPAAKMCGDLIITRRSGNGKEYLLLADAMGHGISATLMLVPLVQAFSSMTQSGQSVSGIVREMNKRLNGFLPSGNFVAVTLLSLDRNARTLEIWNGGNPPPLLSDASGRIVHQFMSRHMAPGILMDEEFDDGTEQYQWHEPATLTIYSDGAMDAVNAAGEEFGLRHIVSVLGRPDSHEGLKLALLDHLGGNMLHDDISLATVRLVT